MSSRDTMIEASIQTICRERNMDERILHAVLREFLKYLHEAQFKSGYRPEDGSLIAQVHWALGDEAAFHLVGLLASGGKGQDAGTVYDTLEYLDAHAKRFATTVQRWQTEVDAEFLNKQ